MPFDTDPEDTGVRIFNTKDLVRMRRDGLVEMVGRKDRQVKIRGHRANLIDVESELRACAGISSSAAIAVRDERLELSIVAFVVPATTLGAASGEELRLTLKSRLPPHMVPQRIHVVERIPLLPTFKVDVAALEEIDRIRHQLGSGNAEPSALDIPNESAARRPLSHPRIRDAVRNAWVEALKGTPLDRNASFEAAGGDSLRALHMWSMIESALGQPLSFDGFDLAMTLEALAAVIEKQCQERPEESGAVANKPLHIFYMPTAGGDTFSQARFRKTLGPSVTFEAVRYPTVEEMLDTGSSFEFLVECVVRQIMTASGAPLYIMGYSFGGFVAWAVACRIKQLGGEIGLVALIDPRRHDDAHEPVPPHRFVLQIADRIVRDPRYAAERAFQNSLAWFLGTSSSRVASGVFRCSALLPSPLRFKFEFHFADQLRMASARQWRPQPLDCPAVLFRSDEFLPSNPDFGWKAVCPSLDVVPVHGTHDTMFDSPNRDHLCERILSVINAHERKTHDPRIAADTNAAQSQEGLPT
jgi:thioesterase domain-containing protein